MALRVDLRKHSATIRRMGYNKRKIEADRKEADDEMAVQRATDAWVSQDAQKIIASCNARQARRTRFYSRGLSGPPYPAKNSPR
jgi:hypothetical protein